MSGDDDASLPEALQGRFEGVRVLGRGAFGRVVLARDLELRRDVALKLLKLEGARRPDFLPRFEREARLAAEVRSPHVAQVFDFGVAGEVPYIVSEYLAGPTLLEAIRQAPGGRLHPEEATARLREVLRGLAALHERGAVHRDLKPANVMLRDGAEAVLIDLGLGRREEDVTLTKTGAILGTPVYMPPQQMTAADPSPSWDVYAAAAMYWEMLTGRRPWAQGTYPELHDVKCAGPPGALAEQGVPVPGALDRLVARALDPGEGPRPADARAFLHALEAAWRGEGGPEGTAALPSMSPSGRSKRGRERSPAGFTAGAVAGLGVGLAASLGLFLREEPASPAARERPVPAARAPAQVPANRGAAEDLERLLEEIAVTPSIQEAVALTSRTSRDEALRIWRRARAAFVGLARARDLRGAVDLALREPLDPVTYTAAARLSLYERLLTATTLPYVPPLWRAGGDPGLGRLLGRGLAVRPEPSMSGWVHGDGEGFRRRYREALAQGGRSWAALRTIEDLEVPGHPEAGAVDNVRIQNLNGDPYRSVMEDRATHLARDFYDAPEWERFRITPTEVEVELQPVEGDLVLAMVVHGWSPTTHMELVLRGPERTTRAVYTPAPLPEPTKLRRPDGSFENARQGLMLRFRREILPEGAEHLTMVLRGLQPLASPKAYREVQEIFQLVGGPLPPGLELP